MAGAISSPKQNQLFDDVQIRKASQAAKELQQHIANATNVKTGKLDLSQLSISLKNSKKSIDDYYQSMKQVEGGEQTFQKLAKAISEAEAPTLKLNSKLSDFAKTLKTAASYQISGAIIQGLGSAISQAYGYAQDLDKSLNNIQIVTGRSSEQMAQFARQANEAAKALSTTTTTYTDAALIYYQQGLDDDKVKERTDVTIKMANVAQESATDVSNYMTAIWNNFDDGSRSLEHYGDVMTNLGANTASSTKEIAAGISKFASVTKTIGLSYDYATTALATVVDKTRESADVVGTAYKTLFSRIEGLSLGKTLEDGTTLNKYSANLAKVGISIKDQNGELKDMDTILDEMGNKWGDLSKDQQIALAQGVAGVRQYTQLVALMDSWDSFQQNLAIAQNSDGTLQQQADIYAQSWEAARNRVKAAWEGVYDDLINADFFIKVADVSTAAIDGIEGIVRGLGGMKGILTGVGAIFTTVFASEAPKAIQNLQNNFSVLTGKAQKDSQEMLTQTQQALASSVTGDIFSNSIELDKSRSATLAELQSQYAATAATMTDAEREAYKAKVESVKETYNQIDALIQEKQAAEELAKVTTKQVAGQFAGGFSKAKANAEKAQAAQDKTDNGFATTDNAYFKLSSQQEEAAKAAEKLQGVQTVVMQLEQEHADLLAKNAAAQGQASSAAQQGLQGELQLYETVNGNVKLNEQAVAALETRYNALASALLQQHQQESQTFAGLQDIQNSMESQGKEWGDSIANGAIKGEKEIENLRNSMKNYLSILQGYGKEYEFKLPTKEVEEFEKVLSDTSDMDKWLKKYEELRNAMNASSAENAGENAYNNFINNANEKDRDTSEVRAAADKVQELAKEAYEIDFPEGEVRSFGAALDQAEASAGRTADALKNLGESTGMKGAVEGAQKVAQASEEVVRTDQQITETNKRLGQTLGKTTQGHVTMSQALMQSVGAAMSLATAVTSITGAWKTLNDESASTGQKVMAVISALVATTGALNTVISANTALKSASTGATVALTAAEGGASAATGVLAGAVGALNMALNAGGIGVFIAALGGIVAIAYGVGKAFKHIIDNTPENQLKSAAKEADNLRKNLQDVQAESSQLENTFSHYDEVVNKIKNCTGTTEEWTAALQEASDITDELLKKYPELASQEGALERDETTGAYRLTDQGKEYIQQQQSNKEVMARAESQAADRKEQEIQIEIDKDKISSAISEAAVATGNGYGLSKETAGIIADNYNSLDFSSNESLEESLNNVFKNQLEGYEGTENLKPLVEALTDPINNLQSQLQEYNSTAGDIKSSQAIQYANEAAKIIAESGTTFSNEVTKGAGTTLASLERETLEAIKNGTEPITEDLFKGYENAKLNADGSLSYTERDENGEAQSKTLDTDATQILAAELKAREQLVPVLETQAAKTEELNDKSYSLTEAVTKSLAESGDLSQLTKGQLEIFASQMEKMAGDTYSEKLKNFLGDNFKFVEQQIPEAFDNFASKIELESRQTAARLDQAGEILPQSLQRLSLGTQELIAQQISDAQANGSSATESVQNTEALKYFYDSLAKQGEDVEAVAQGLANIDWNTASVDDVQKVLQDLGISAGDSLYACQELCSIFQKMPQDAFDVSVAFGTIAEGMAAIDKDGVLKMPQDSEKNPGPSALIDKYGEEYFQMMADGTYKLLIDAEKFQEIVRQDEFTDLLTSANENIKEKVELGNDIAIANHDQMKWDGDHQVIDKDAVSAQLQLISALSDGDEKLQGRVEKLTESFKNNTLSMADLNEIQQEAQNAVSGHANKIDAADQQVREKIDTAMGATQNTDEISSIKNAASDMGVEIDAETQGKALLRLTTGYENCKDAADKYIEAMRGTNEELQATAMSEMDLAVRAGEHAEASKLNAEQLEAMAEAFKESGEAGDEAVIGMEAVNEAAADAAERTLRANRGVADLAKNYQSYADILNEVQNATDAMGAAQAFASDNGDKLRESLADILDISADLVDIDLVKAIDPDDFLAAANGDEEAISRISNAFFDLQQAFLEGLDTSAFEDFNGEMDAFQEKLNNLKPGEALDEQAQIFIQALADMMAQAGMSADEIKERFSGMQIECDVTPVQDSLNALADTAADTSATVGANMDAAVDAMGINASTSSETTEATDNYQEMGFVENVEPGLMSATGQVPETDESGKTEMAYITAFMPTFTKTVDEAPVEGETTKTETATAVKVENAHKAAGGAISHSNKGGARTGGSRGGGRRGGSRRRTPRRRAARRARGRRQRIARHDARSKEQDEKDPKEEKERYHVVRKELEQIEDKLTKIDKKKNRAFGKAKMKAIDEEADALRENIKIQKKYVKEIRNYLKEDTQRMQKYGAKFDKDGVIQNYDALVQGQVNRFNAAVEAYNKAQAKAAALLNQAEDAKIKENDKKAAQLEASAKNLQEQSEKNFETASKDYETFQKAMKQYEETVALLDSEEGVLTDKLNEAHDKFTEKITYVAEIQIRLNTNALTILEEKLKQIEDQTYNTKDALVLFGKEMERYFGNGKGLDGLQEVNRKEAAAIFLNPDYADKGGKEISDKILNNEELTSEDLKKIKAMNLTEEEVDNLQKVFESTAENLEEIRSIRDKVFAQLNKTFSESIDPIDKNLTKMKELHDMTQTYLDVIEISGKQKLDPLGETTLKLTQEAQDQAVEMAANQKQLAEELATEAAELEKKYEESVARGEETEAKAWKAALETVESRRQQALSDFQSSWKESLELANKVFEVQMNNAVDAMERSLSGAYGSLEKFATAFNRSNTLKGIHVEEYEKIYQISKLTRDINKSIDSTSNVKSKKELLALEEKIHAIQESGQELSQYDLDYMRKRYELLLAGQQLSESQQTKSKVTMRKDANGGWGYVYTADQDSVADAEQNYEDKLHEMQQMSSEYINNLQDEIVSTEQEMTDALRNMRVQDYASQEEYEAAVAETTFYYQKLIEEKYGELNTTLDNQMALYGQDWAAYSALTGYKIADARDFEMSFEQTSLGILSSMGNVQSAINGASPEIVQGLENIKDQVDVLRVMTSQNIWAGLSGLTGVAQALSAEGGGFNLLHSGFKASEEDYYEWAEYAKKKNKAVKEAAAGGGKGVYDNLKYWGEETNGYVEGWGSTNQEHISGWNTNSQGYVSSFATTSNETLSNFGKDSSGNQVIESPLSDAEESVKTWSTTVQGHVEAFGSGAEGSLRDSKTPVNQATQDMLSGITSPFEIYGTESDPKNPLTGPMSQAAINRLNELGVDVKAPAEEVGKNVSEYFDKKVNDKTKGIPGVLDKLDSTFDTFNKESTKEGGFYKTWEKNTEEAMEAAGHTIENFGEETEEKFFGKDGISEQYDELSEQVSKDTVTMGEKMTETIGKVWNWQKEWSAAIKQAETDWLHFMEQLQKIQVSLGKADIIKEAEKTAEATTGGKQETSKKETPKQETPKKEKEVPNVGGFIVGDNVKITNNGRRVAHAVSHSRSQGEKNHSKCRYIYTKNHHDWRNKEDVVDKIDTTGDYGVHLKKINMWIHPSNIKKFDTGGYTGEWGEEGKIAMLHQKEMVLNKKDTANMLSAVSVVRDIVKNINLNAITSKNTLSSLFNVSPKVDGVSNNSEIKQDIIINAEFPSVTSESEIQNAFSNLLNKATQFMGRK